MARKPTFYDHFSSFEVESGARCSSFCGGKSNANLISLLPSAPHVKTVWDMFQNGAAISHNDHCLGWRNGDSYAWLSYDQVLDQVRHIATALVRKTPLQRQGFIGIFSTGCPQWIVTALAAYSRSLAVVPLYDRLSSEARSYIINETEMSTVFIDSLNAISQVLSEARSTPSLRLIVSFQENLSDELLSSAREANIQLVSLKTFAQFDSEDLEVNVFDPPTPEDLFMIMYTSGTTGLPKGVMLTHKAIVANFASLDYMFQSRIHRELVITKYDCCLLFLPLAHAYAQLLVVWFLYHGASIGFNSGNVLNLMEDAALLRPTFMPLVPRLMNRLYSKITAKVAESRTKSAIFWFCYQRKKALLESGIITRSSVWDWLAFRQLQNLVGGRVWLMSVGSAPVAPEIIEFWRIVFGVILIEGYGQTECTAAATFALDYQGGHVGHPGPSNLIKLVDVPEYGYFANGDLKQGEVCIKGDNVMKGYYKQPDKTGEVLDADGWLHTGDIGQFLENGALKLIDRKNNIFKLAQGEYIAPEKIEGVYNMCPLVAQIFVDGNSFQWYPVAILVPEPSFASEWAAKNGVQDEKLLETDLEFAKHLLKAIREFGTANNLSSIEQVKAIYVTTEPFSPDNGLLTPTLKNKRHELRKFFQKQIDIMCQTGPMLL